MTDLPPNLAPDFLWRLKLASMGETVMRVVQLLEEGPSAKRAEVKAACTKLRATVEHNMVMRP